MAAKILLPTTSIRIHCQLLVQCGVVKPAQAQTALEQPSIDRVLQSARQVLASDECLDRTRNQPLLVHIDQRLEMHGRWERWERIEHLRVRRRRKVSRIRLGTDQFCRRSRIDQVWQAADSL